MHSSMTSVVVLEAMSIGIDGLILTFCIFAGCHSYSFFKYFTKVFLVGESNHFCYFYYSITPFTKQRFGFVDAI